MTVSIVMAAYNAAAYIDRAIASVRAQTHADWELIVSDDGSTDATAALVEAIAIEDPRVRLLRTDRNRGPSGARNAALAAAGGEWIAILDADDAFRPTRLADLLAIASGAGADLVADDLLLFDGAAGREVGPALGIIDRPDRPLDAITILRAERPWPGPRLGFLKPMIRRRLLVDQGLSWHEGLRHSEDLVLLVQAALVARAPTLSSTAGYVYTQPARRKHRSAVPGAGDLVTGQRAEAGRFLLDRYANHPDAGVRRAVRDYAAWTHDIARGARAITALRAGRPTAVGLLLAAGPRAVARYVVTMPWAKRVLRAAGLTRQSIG